jgi:hypothetical protein
MIDDRALGIGQAEDSIQNNLSSQGGGSSAATVAEDAEQQQEQVDEVEIEPHRAKNGDPPGADLATYLLAHALDPHRR